MTNESPNHIYWTREGAEGLSYVPGVDLKNHKTMKGNLKPQFKKTGAKVAKPKQTCPTKAKISNPPAKSFSQQSTNTSVSSQTKQASLKDLCAEDKERVANLIRELAKAGEEKEATENQLNDERRQFVFQLDELKSDKDKIEQEQKSLLVEFKECQRLLVFYQQKITEEQKEVARDINRLLNDSSLNKQQVTTSSRKGTPRRFDTEEYDDDIRVKEVDGTLSSHRSATDSHYTDVAGSLGESFRPAVRFAKLTDEVSRDTDKNGARGSSNSDDGSEKEAIFRSREAKKAENMSTDDDNVTDSTGAFEQRIRALSPNGRREALLKQKRDLEVEQAHLHSLLTEQEEILRFRQEELKKRHVEYTRRMHHFKKHGDFPSVLSSMAGAQQQEDTENMCTYDSGDDRMNESSSNITTFAQVGSPRRQRSHHKPRSEPVMRRRKYVDDSPTTDSDTPNEGSATMTSTFPTHSKLSPDRPSTREREQFGGISDVTNLYSSKASHRSPRNISRIGPLPHRNSNAKKSSSAHHSSSLLSHSELSSRSPHRSTMNNFDTLSDLVSSVEASQTPRLSETTPLYTSHTSSAHSDDTMVSMTFDPEDSQLLEDIFFIN